MSAALARNQPFQTVKRVATEALAGRLVRNFSWIVGAEIISRLGRIATAVILARSLDAVEFGVAALALTVFELVRLFTENGVGAAVIRATDATFDAVANRASGLMWTICAGLAAIQLAIAGIVALAIDRPELGWMIATLSGVYLIMPFGLVHAYVLQRQQRFKRLALVASAQTTTDHILTALFAVLGLGAWAIIFPKLLTAPIWLVGVSYDRPWRPKPAAGNAPLGGVASFAAPVLGAELATALRDHADKLVVSALLGVEALGIYYFAFNAGLGLSSAVNRAFNAAIYPHLCDAAQQGRELVGAFDRVLTVAAPALTLVYLAQAAAALVYVPILFGADWAYAAPLVALLCLTGPARLGVDAARMLLRAAGRTALELCVSAAFATAMLGALMLGVSTGELSSAALLIALAGVIACAAAVHAARRGAQALKETD